MSPPATLNAYRTRVRTLYAPEFKLALDIAGEVEAATLQPRSHPTLPAIVLDMLLIQALKAHVGVVLLCEHGLMEDAATLTRRLLELSVQAIYIGADDQEKTREERAGKYLAFMWRHFPRRIKQKLPAELRLEWAGIARRYGRLVRKKAKSWGPNWKDMFAAIGHSELYSNDYAFLSGIAHGSPDDQILTFAQGTIRVHGHKHVPVLLVYGSRYYVAVVEQWDRQFKVLPAHAVDRMSQSLATWRLRKTSGQGA